MVQTIVVCVDFGTTFSGVAWAYSKKPEDIRIISNWDSEYNSCSDRHKVPTQLEYGSVNANTKWGYSIPPGKQVIQWFKLLLLNGSDIPEDIVKSSQFKNAVKQQESLGISRIDLVAVFLRGLWDHALAAITRSLGKTKVDTSKLHIVLTIPAIWPHYIQNRMKAAAQRAGLLNDRQAGKTTLDFLAEPEAAALAVMNGFQPRPDINDGDTIVICDAGGGTVDLISYQVKNTDPFEIVECVSGKGGLCGGIFVDQNFESLIASKVGQSVWSKIDTGEKRKFMNKDWENGIKTQFHTGDRQWMAEVPAGSLPGNKTGRKRRATEELDLTTDELLGVFTPVVDQIHKLVQQQLDSIKDKGLTPPKYIILVGGFGGSRYLHTTFKMAHPGTTILQSADTYGWTAICRGGVMHGMARKRKGVAPQVTVSQRIARRSYGFAFNAVWDPKIHNAEDRYWCEVERTWRATNQMEWVLKQGSTLSDGHQSTYCYYRPFFPDDDPATEEQLHCCSSLVPPQRVTPDVQKACIIKWKRPVDVSKLPMHQNGNGQSYRQLNFTIKVTVSGPVLDIEILHDNKKVADHNVEIEF